MKISTILTLAVLCLIQFGTMSDNALLANALSNLAVDFHTDMGKIQVANAIYPLVCASVMVIAGFLGNSIGWKKLLLIGLLIIAIAELIAFISVSFMVFSYVARVLAGIGAGLSIPGVLGYITMNFSKKDSVLAFGIIAAVMAVGASAAPILNGYIIVALSWRVGFLLLAILFCFAFLASIPLLQKDALKKEKPANFDFIGAMLLFIGVTLFLFGLSQISSWGFVMPVHAPFTILNMSPCLFIIVLALVILFFYLHYEHLREDRLGHQFVIIPRVFLSNHEVRAGILMSAFVFFILGGINFALVLYMQIVLGKNAMVTGLYLSILAFGMAIASLGTSAILQNYSPKQLCRAGIILSILACFVTIFGIGRTDVNSFFYLGLFFLGVGCGMVASQANFAVTSAIPDTALASKSMGIQGAARNFGQAIGIALVGLSIMFGLQYSIHNQVNDNRILSDYTENLIEIQPNIQFVSNIQLTNLLEHNSHISPSEKDYIVNINEKARAVAIHASLLVMTLICIVFLFISFGLIATKLKDLKK